VPAVIVKRLEAEMREVLASPAMRERLASLGALPASGGSKELGEFVRAETSKWAAVTKASQIKVD
jgi:tripartite-type tricarboxylate transporter receptor subunit TctC